MELKVLECDVDHKAKGMQDITYGSSLVVIPLITAVAEWLSTVSIQKWVGHDVCAQTGLCWETL